MSRISNRAIAGLAASTLSSLMSQTALASMVNVQVPIPHVTIPTVHVTVPTAPAVHVPVLAVHVPAPAVHIAPVTSGATRWIEAGHEAFMVEPLAGCDLADVWREVIR